VLVRATVIPISERVRACSRDEFRNLSAKGNAMFKKITMLALALFAFSGTTALLTGCHTTAGAGEDISKTGQAIEKSAEKHTP
jgi:predicted small secreted protein